MKRVVWLALALLLAAPAHAEDPTRRAQRLDPLELDAAKGFSVTEYELQSGTYYRWRIASDGREDYALRAPDLFRNSWIDKVSVDDTEVRATALDGVDMGEEGEVDIWFVPVRPGDYPFWVERLEGQGFRGVVHVR